MVGLFIALLISAVSLTGAELPVQVVPQGIESVNGSDVNMGCTSPLVDSGGVMVCNSTDCPSSYLLDGNSPAIDTSTSNWASQLVTVRKNDATHDIPYDHVVLTFGFDTAVSPTLIELDLFLCPEWNIGAPFISVYADEKNSLVFNSSSDFIKQNTPSQTSCDSHSTITISFEELSDTTSPTWHIVVTFAAQPDTEWVHVGEVRFLGTDSPPVSMCTTEGPSSSTTEGPSLSTSEESTVFLTAASAPIPSSSESVVPSTTVIGTSPITSSTPNTAPTSFTASPQANPSVNTMVLALSLVIALLILVVLVLLAVIGLCFVGRRYRRARKFEAVKTVSYELKEPEKISVGDTRNNSDNRIAATNPGLFETNSRYFCPDTPVPPVESQYDVIKDTMIYPVKDGDYDEVCIDEIKASVKDGRSDDVTDKNMSTQARVDDEEYDTGLYELVSPIDDSTIKEVASSPVRTEVKRDERVYSLPNSPDLSEVEDERAAVPVRVYSVVQKTTPIVPPKSSDLEHYLSIRVFNENIYSESINPSDFTHRRNEETEKAEEEVTDPLIYSPIYPPPTALPECCPPPVEITSDNFIEKSVLRTGQFGEVVLADTIGLSLKDMQLSKIRDNRNMSILVAVKKLKPNPSQFQREAFDVEAKFMSRLRHPNMARLLGVRYAEPAFIMMEYMKEGDLSQFLQRYSEIVTMPSSNSQIPTSTLVYMASQIASAMKYLAALNFIHRDLASRNCLVGKNYTVKVADLGVTKDIYQSHYFRVQGNTLLPIRWMATECFNGKFSEKSDVWAFGVTMWELFTLARDVPYPHLSDEEVIHNTLKREYRQFPSKPVACPQPVYEIMEQCWVTDMQQRATFTKLHMMLQTSS